MLGMSPRKTVRARKARRASTCPACQARIDVGDPICSADGAAFRHEDCDAAADRSAAAIARRFGRPVETISSL
jgi:hypothetical protein